SGVHRSERVRSVSVFRGNEEEGGMFDWAARLGPVGDQPAAKEAVVPADYLRGRRRHRRGRDFGHSDWRAVGRLGLQRCPSIQWSAIGAQRGINGRNKELERRHRTVIYRGHGPETLHSDDCAGREVYERRGQSIVGPLVIWRIGEVVLVEEEAVQ